MTNLFGSFEDIISEMYFRTKGFQISNYFDLFKPIEIIRYAV